MTLIELKYPNCLIVGNSEINLEDCVSPWDFHVEVGDINQEVIEDHVLHVFSGSYVAVSSKEIIALDSSRERARLKAIIKGDLHPSVVPVDTYFSKRLVPEQWIENIWPFKKYMSFYFSESFSNSLALKDNIVNAVHLEDMGGKAKIYLNDSAKIRGAPESLDIYVTRDIDLKIS